MRYETAGSLREGKQVWLLAKMPSAKVAGDEVEPYLCFTNTTRLVGEGFNLFEQSGELAEYDNHFIVERIDGIDGSIRFLNGITLYEGDAIGKVNEDVLRRIQIRETIRTHIERERELFSKGIKVLSLFFIDHVNSYRIYDKTVLATVNSQICSRKNTGM